MILWFMRFGKIYGYINYILTKLSLNKKKVERATQKNERRQRRNLDFPNQKPSASLTQIPTNPDLSNPNPSARTKPRRRRRQRFCFPLIPDKLCCIPDSHKVGRQLSHSKKHFVLDLAIQYHRVWWKLEQIWKSQRCQNITFKKWNYLSQSGMSGSFSLGLMGSIVLQKQLELATRIPEG